MISDKGIPIKFLLFVLLCVYVSGDGAEVRCIAREREALLSFKKTLIGDVGILSSWRNDECCEWYGVVCSNTTRHVIALQLNACDLEGVLQGCNVGPSFPKWIQTQRNLSYLDLSRGGIRDEATSLAQLQYLAVLDLSNNDLFGKIPTTTQHQSFDASAYAENDGLCGPPLPALCPKDSLRPPTPNLGENVNEKDNDSLSFMQEVCISMAFGVIFGFWGVVGSFILKKSWRIAYFNFWDAVGDWFYVRIVVFLSKWRRS